MKTYWGSGCINPRVVFLTSALVGGEWSALRSCRFAHGKEPLVAMDGRLDGPQSRSGEVKILDPTGTRTSAHGSFSPQPVGIPTELPWLTDWMIVDDIYSYVKRVSYPRNRP
jgi:hypothetical protein